MTSAFDTTWGLVDDPQVAARGRWHTTMGRLLGLLDRYGPGLAALSAVLLVSAWAQAANMYGAPQRRDDEGTYVAQAWAVMHWHVLAPYTYWYDHPPLGWIIMAGWFAITGGLHHAPSAVDAGRQFMFFIQELNAALLYLLARRVGMARWTSALAVVAFSVSPLAIVYHRTVYLDNIGMPFVLGAFVLARSPRRHLHAIAASGLCMGMAVLCKETFLVLLPVWLWEVWRAADRRTRAFVVSTAVSLFVLTGSMYVLYAALRGELLPGKGHVSLIGAVDWQLFQRHATGSVLSAHSVGASTVHSWLATDRWLLGAGIVFLPIALARRSTRVVAGALAIQAATMLRPGYLPIPFVIGLLPFAALSAAAGVDTLWHWQPARLVESAKARLPRLAGRTATGRFADAAAGSLSVRLLGPAVAALCLAVGAVAVAPAWANGDRAAFSANSDAPYMAAQHWISSHVPRYDRIIVDDGLWVDLVQEGFPPSQVVWFYKLGADSRVQHEFPQGWRDMQYLVESATVRQAISQQPWLQAALTHSKAVASWGRGDLNVTIRQIPATSQSTGSATGP